METAAGFDPEKYDSWIEEELSDKPMDARVFLRCVYETGVDVLDRTDGLPREFLSLSDYLEGDTRLYRKYEALILDAAADPDRFVYGMHRELTEISRYIRENSLYADLFDLYSGISKLRVYFTVQDVEAGIRVSSAYEWLLLATYNYLAPSGYDNSRMLCGRSTDGELLYCDRFHPYAGELQLLAFRDCAVRDEKGRPPVPDAAVRNHAAEFGYTDAPTYADLSVMQVADEFQREQAANLSPFINEYTYDILPGREHIYNMDTRALEALRTSLDPDAAPAALDARNGTLPANGIRYDFSYDPRVPEGARLRSLLMKEVLHRDRIVMLYRLRFSGQDLCGYYDLEDQVFCSPFAACGDSREDRIAANIFQTVLYLYSSATTRDGGDLVREFGEHFRAAADPEDETGYPVSVTPHLLGGELRKTYGEPAEPDNPCEDGENGRPRRTLQGYIRKLAPGDLPSAESAARAEALHFALAEDEVYEEPFWK